MGRKTNKLCKHLTKCVIYKKLQTQRNGISTHITWFGYTISDKRGEFCESSKTPSIKVRKIKLNWTTTYWNVAKWTISTIMQDGQKHKIQETEHFVVLENIWVHLFATFLWIISSGLHSKSPYYYQTKSWCWYQHRCILRSRLHLGAQILFCHFIICSCLNPQTNLL